MTNRTAAKILGHIAGRKILPMELDSGKVSEALRLAIAALESPLLAVDHKREGAKGIKVRNKSLKAKDFKKWGRMGGRPKKAA